MQVHDSFIQKASNKILVRQRKDVEQAMCKQHGKGKAKMRMVKTRPSRSQGLVTNGVETQRTLHICVSALRDLIYCVCVGVCEFICS